MKRLYKVEAWVVLVAVVLAAGILAVVHWQRQKPISIRGAVLVQDSDPRKQQPIVGVIISAGVLALSDAKSDSSGFFVLNLRKLIRRRHAITLSFRDSQYGPLVLNDFVSDKLFVVHLVPLSTLRLRTINQKLS